MQPNVNPQLLLAYNFLHYTNKNIFLTGKAGTGKTTFLKNLKGNSPKRMVVVAPTGVAAINAGGVTIHSFFQLPFSPFIPVKSGETHNHLSVPDESRTKRFSKNKINLIKSIDLLVIDEISMVRADILDAIDETLRTFKNRGLPFGGVQVLMIGDLQQLAPIVRNDERAILERYYDTFYFFGSHALKKSHFIGIELKHIYRQSDTAFINLLNKIRDNRLDGNDITLLNSRYKPDFIPDEDEGYITLTTHNYQSKQINGSRLKNINNKLFKFECKTGGDFPENTYPADKSLEIKEGAQVMFIKNDSSFEKRFYNGKIGKVTAITDNKIEILSPGDSSPVTVEPVEWLNMKYRLNKSTLKIEEEVTGTFIQFPVKLAWAITIHKSQGLTFEKAVIDAGKSFAHGQVYVALSRCKSLGGLILSTPLNQESLFDDHTITGFNRQVENNQPDEADLTKYRKEYEMQLLNELFSFRSILQRVSEIRKILENNASSVAGNLNGALSGIMEPLDKEIVETGEKFLHQILKIRQNESQEAEILLNRRLRQASDYFLPKLEQHIELPLQNAGFESDNQSVRKRLTEGLTQLAVDVEVKKACLKSLTNGFTIKEYLYAKAVPAIQEDYTARGFATLMKIKNPDFYNLLFKWRIDKSVETGLAESRILRQKTMAEIASKLPRTAVELRKIKGMGGKKMELAGHDIMAMILDYRIKKGMELPLNPHEEVAIAGLDTKEASLALLKTGLTIDQIAKKRKLAVATVENHLTHYVKIGRLDVFEVVERNKYDIIAGYLLEKSDKESLTDIKNKLGDDFSYGEIRLVMAGLP